MMNKTTQSLKELDASRVQVIENNISANYNLQRRCRKVNFVIQEKSVHNLHIIVPSEELSRLKEEGQPSNMSLTFQDQGNVLTNLLQERIVSRKLRV